jgi:hypothetical protein
MAPVPTGGIALAGNGTEGYYQSLFTTKYGAAAGNAYAAYNKNHPGSSAYANAQAFLEIILVQGLDKALAEGVGGAGSTAAGVPAAAAQGASNAYNTLTAPLTGINAIGAFFNSLGKSGTWIRVAKVVFGGALLVVGLVHITGISGAAANVARKVPLPI